MIEVGRALANEGYEQQSAQNSAGIQTLLDVCIFASLPERTCTGREGADDDGGRLRERRRRSFRGVRSAVSLKRDNG